MSRSVIIHFTAQDDQGIDITSYRCRTQMGGTDSTCPYLNLIPPTGMNIRQQTGTYILSNLVPGPKVSCIVVKDMGRPVNTSIERCWTWTWTPARTPNTQISAYDQFPTFREIPNMGTTNSRDVYLFYTALPLRNQLLATSLCSYDTSFTNVPPSELDTQGNAQWYRCGAPLFIFPVQVGNQPITASPSVIGGMNMDIITSLTPNGVGWHKIWVKMHYPDTLDSNPAFITFCVLPSADCRGAVQPPAQTIGHGGGSPSFLPSEQINGPKLIIGKTGSNGIKGKPIPGNIVLGVIGKKITSPQAEIAPTPEGKKLTNPQLKATTPEVCSNGLVLDKKLGLCVPPPSEIPQTEKRIPPGQEIPP